MNRESIKKDIAIIGISCKFSRSQNATEFWKNLKDGNELIEFYEEEELLKSGIDESLLRNPNFVKIKSFLKNTDSFDYKFFSYTKDEANLMDPQIRLLHEQVWLAMEDAGYNPLSFQEKIGMYTSASDNFNWIAHSMMSGNNNVDPFYLSQISNKNFISTLISYNMNFKGPSVVVDSACSSSLTSVHLACRGLLLRECSLAVASGVDLSTTTQKGYIYQEGMILSKDGHCRTFDKESSGTTAANGIGSLILKRLEDAIKDKDHVYAVIRSSAINNDGRRKVGYTAPSITGQADCIKMAHRFANIPYNTISYIEAHGTGTTLGDPVEIEALNKAFEYDTSFKCAIGSLKSNTGHLGHAAGIAGLIKTTLALKNKMIPPSLHFHNPNPEINFKEGPFFVNTVLKEWRPNGEQSLRAGVSSFGIGGTNAHVVLESFEDKKEMGSESRPFQLITFSAKSLQSLKSYKEKLNEFVVEEKFNLADLAYSLNVGRADFDLKAYIVCRSKEELSERLSNLVISADDKIYKKEDRKLAFVFPGQGSQYYKMGLGLYNSEPDFKICLDQGFQILREITGIDYSEILGYKENESIDATSINNTLHTQPILFLFEYALASVLLKWGIKPDYMIGHSLGEYVAACIAEVFTLNDALKLIVKRAQLMEGLEAGEMLSVGAAKDTILKLLLESLSIAAINSEDSCVVSGNKIDMSSFAKILESKGIAYKRLKTSHAFHSKMMDDILSSYEEELSKITFRTPKMCFISNLSGREILEEDVTSSKYWTRHLRETVLFKDGADFLLQQDNLVFIEIGPGNTLSTFIKQSDKYSNKCSCISLLRGPSEDTNDNEKFTVALGEIWKQHIPINKEQYYSWEERYRISAPTYCFDQYKFDVLVDPLKNFTNKIDANAVKPFDDWFYIPAWKSRFLIAKREHKQEITNILVFSDSGRLIKSLIKEFIDRGHVVVEVLKGTSYKRLDNRLFTINPDSKNDFQSLFRVCENDGLQFAQIVFNWHFEDKGNESALAVFSSINNLCRNSIEHVPEKRKKITLLDALNFEIVGNEKRNSTMVSAMGQLYVCSQENPSIFSCSIDVNQEINDVQTTSRVADDIITNYSDTTISYRNGCRWIAYYENVNLDGEIASKYLSKDKIYLITGGLGMVGQILANFLSETYNSKIILVGRTTLPDEKYWNDLLQNGSTNKDVASTIKALKDLRENSSQIYYYQADVSNYHEFSQIVNKIEKDHGVLNGIIHAAGNLDHNTFKPIENLDEVIAERQFAPKINGLLNLERILKNRCVDFVWITSSLAAILGGLTFGAYAVANSYMDSVVNARKDLHPNWFSVNLDGIGEEKIDAVKLIEIFKKSFSLDFLPQLIVSVKDPNTFKLYHNLPPEETDPNFLGDFVEQRDAPNSDYVEPMTETEKIICELVDSFFGYKKIGVRDNFFDIGGDSLKAMTIIRRINKLFGIEMSVQDFYSKQTIYDLANEIDLATNIVRLKQTTKGENTFTI